MEAMEGIKRILKIKTIILKMLLEFIEIQFQKLDISFFLSLPSLPSL